MSTNVSAAIETARSLRTWTEIDRLADAKRQTFLDRLHASAQTVSGIQLGDWDKNFVADLVASPRPFDDQQRDAIDGLRRRFEHRL